MQSLLKDSRKERGIALATSLIFLAILSLLGGTALVLTTTDLQIGSNQRSSAQAFNQANAGISYTLSKIEEELKSSTFSLPASVGANATFSFTQPSGFSFTNSVVITKVSDKGYGFQMTGTGPQNSQTVLDVTFKKDSAINFAVFGDKQVDVGNTAGIYSYDSEVISSPSPSDSTGEADTGSNESVILRNNCVVDGDVALGEDTSGTDASLTDNGGIVSGTNGEDIDRVDPDPLGVVGGEYADNFTTYSTSNDNSNGTYPAGALSGNDLTLGNGETATLVGKSGEANYYFNDIRLNNNSTLYIDTTSGPVNIYLTGEIDAVTGSNFVNTNGGATGSPKDFSIFANSQDNTDKISIGNDVAFAGLIYAPYLTVRMDNSADIYGAIVAKESEITNNVDVYFDTGLINEYDSNNLNLITWRDVRGSS